MSDIKEFADRYNMDIRVGIPVTISDYDAENLCATATPAYKERIMGENDRAVVYEELQPIAEVPFADGWGTRFIPEDDDHGWLFFSDVSLENYITTRDGTQDLNTAAFHDYSDCFIAPLETAKVDRPDPYITIGCDIIQFHRPVQMDETLLVKGEAEFNSSVSMEDELYVTNNVSFGNDFTVDGNTSLMGDFTVQNNVSFFSDFTIDGSASFVGDFTAAGASFSDNVTIGGDLGVDGSATISGNVGGANFVTGATDLNGLHQFFNIHQHPVTTTGTFPPSPIFTSTSNPPQAPEDVEEVEAIEAIDAISPIDVEEKECPVIG